MSFDGEKFLNLMYPNLLIFVNKTFLCHDEKCPYDTSRFRSIDHLELNMCVIMRHRLFCLFYIILNLPNMCYQKGPPSSRCNVMSRLLKQTNQPKNKPPDICVSAVDTFLLHWSFVSFCTKSFYFDYW